MAAQPFKLNPGQVRAQRALASGATNVLLYGGSRSGKTFIIIRSLIARGIKAPGSRHLAARDRQSHIWRTVRLDTFPKVMRLCYPQVEWQVHSREGYAVFGEGSELWFGGLDDEDRLDKILGAEYATIYVNEASRVTYDQVTTLRTRLAQRVEITKGERAGEVLPLRFYADLNPTGRRHWTYQEFHLHKAPISGAPLDPADYAYCVMNPQDNVDNLAPNYIKTLEGLPPAKRKRFLLGEYQSDIEGALWSQDSFRIYSPDELPALSEVVVAVDPSGAKSKSEKADMIGIVVAGRVGDPRTGSIYVLEDATMLGGPQEWAKVAVSAFERHEADAIIVETNFGGAMVASTIRTISPNAPIREVRASRGKHVRAEPVATLYHEGRVFHPVGVNELEDELTQFTSAGYQGSESPNRADALVWAVSGLITFKTASKATVTPRF